MAIYAGVVLEDNICSTVNGDTVVLMTAVRSQQPLIHNEGKQQTWLCTRLCGRAEVSCDRGNHIRMFTCLFCMTKFVVLQSNPSVLCPKMVIFDQLLYSRYQYGSIPAGRPLLCELGTSPWAEQAMNDTINAGSTVRTYNYRRQGSTSPRQRGWIPSKLALASLRRWHPRKWARRTSAYWFDLLRRISYWIGPWYFDPFRLVNTVYGVQYGGKTYFIIGAGLTMPPFPPSPSWNGLVWSWNNIQWVLTQ